MGSSSSKEPSQADFMRATSKRASRRQRASSISLGLKQMRHDIESFDGYRDDPRYAGFQSVLTKSSQDIQNLKHKSKPDTQQFCDNVHADIIDLLRVLEQVVSKNERDLDSGAVESHSFIDQTPNMKKKERPAVTPPERVEASPERVEASPERVVVSPERVDTKSEKSEISFKNKPEITKKIAKYTQRITDLEQLEQNVTKLSKEIDSAIELEDKKQFVMLEKKVNLLYTDLEMLEVEEHTPLHERKESISRKLIRYNNRIRKAKTNAASQHDLSQAVSEEEKKRRVQRELQIIVPIEQELEDLEVRVLTFDDVKGDPKYKELDQALKMHWSTLQPLESSSEANRKRKLKTLDAIKKILQELNSKAEENAAKITIAIEKITSIEDDVFSLTRSVENFDGTRNDVEYKTLDQKLRSLWAKLNDIHGAYEKVESRKGGTIELIQQMLKTLLQNALNNEESREMPQNVSARIDDQDDATVLKVSPKQVLSKQNYDFLMETKELQNHWNTINKIVVQKLSSTDKKDVVQMLDSLTKEINKKIRDIQALSSNSFRGVEDLQKKHVAETAIGNGEIVYQNINIQRNSGDVQNQNQPEDVATVVEQDSRDAKEINGVSEHLQHDAMIDELVNSINAQPAEIKTLPTTEIFGQIQKIQVSLKEIKSRIKSFTGTKEDPEYYELESQVQQHQTSLENVPENLSQIVAKARSKGLNSSHECLRLLAGRVEENREKITLAVQEKIVEAKQEHELLHTQPNKQSETNGDIEIREKSKEETNKLREAMEQLQKLKKKVDCFNGTYKNILYVQIEEELKSCSERIDQLDVSGGEKIATNKAQLQAKVKQYLEILEERSLKVSSQEDLTAIDSKELPYKQINELRAKLTNLKLAMENFLGQYKDANYTRLEQELMNCKKDIEHIADINHSVIVSKKQYSDYISQLQIYFQEKVISENEETIDGKDPQDPATALAHFQQEISILKQQIDGLQYNITEAQYYELDENLLQIMLKVDDIDVQDEDLLELRRNLIQELQRLLTTLQGKKNTSFRNSGQDNQMAVYKVQEIEQEIQELARRISKFPEENHKEEYDSLDEAISTIFLQIQSVETKGNPRIIQTCEDLIKDVQNNQRILNQKHEVVRAGQVFVGKRGTEV